MYLFSQRGPSSLRSSVEVGKTYLCRREAVLWMIVCFPKVLHRLHILVGKRSRVLGAPRAQYRLDSYIYITIKTITLKYKYQILYILLLLLYMVSPSLSSCSAQVLCSVIFVSRISFLLFCFFSLHPPVVVFFFLFCFVFCFLSVYNRSSISIPCTAQLSPLSFIRSLEFAVVPHHYDDYMSIVGGGTSPTHPFFAVLFSHISRISPTARLAIRKLRAASSFSHGAKSTEATPADLPNDPNHKAARGVQSPVGPRLDVVYTNALPDRTSPTYTLTTEMNKGLLDIAYKPEPEMAPIVALNFMTGRATDSRGGALPPPPSLDSSFKTRILPLGISAATALKPQGYLCTCKLGDRIVLLSKYNNNFILIAGYQYPILKCKPKYNEMKLTIQIQIRRGEMTAMGSSASSMSEPSSEPHVVGPYRAGVQVADIYILDVYYAPLTSEKRMKRFEEADAGDCNKELIDILLEKLYDIQTEAGEDMRDAVEPLTAIHYARALAELRCVYIVLKRLHSDERKAFSPDFYMAHRCYYIGLFDERHQHKIAVCCLLTQPAAGCREEPAQLHSRSSAHVSRNICMVYTDQSMNRSGATTLRIYLLLNEVRIPTDLNPLLLRNWVLGVGSCGMQLGVDHHVLPISFPLPRPVPLHHYFTSNFFASLARVLRRAPPRTTSPYYGVRCSDPLHRLWPSMEAPFIVGYIPSQLEKDTHESDASQPLKYNVSSVTTAPTKQ
eukprot:gene3642-2577_t